MKLNLTLMLGLFWMPSAFAGSLKVVSYNVNFFNSPNRVAKDLNRPNLTEADVILLQEVTRDQDRNWDPVTHLAQQLKLYSVFLPSGFIRGMEYGNAILSKRPLKNAEVIVLPHSPVEFKGNVRSGVIADIELENGESITLSSVHLSVFFCDSYGYEESRAFQLEFLLKRLRDRGSKNIIFGGDLNTTNPMGWKRVKKVATDYQYKNSYPHMTWTMKYLRLKLDHLFHQGDLEPIHAGVGYDTQGSDHHPIWVDYQLSDNALISKPPQY